MSYEFKKLSEVQAMDVVPEGAKVLAEANGQIVRVPGSGLGSGTGGGVQPDWNENDETSKAYILNRPFYEDKLLIVTYNAVAGNETTTLTWYKVSDAVPSIDAEQGKEVSVWLNGQSGDSIIDSVFEDGYFVSEMMAVVALTDNFKIVFGEETATFPEKGTYFISMNGITVNGIAAFGSSEPEISWDGNPGSVKKIDEKFIPDMTSVVLKSSTADSTKRFKITVNDSGALTATEVKN